MRAAIPTELLLRLMNATEEQYAAIEKILGVSASGEVASDDDARRLFALLKALESEGNYRKSPVTRVFQFVLLGRINAR
ncbi:MAG: hypothetical protein QM813_01380 [Verrucomicrobiota bacterium]